MSDPRPEEFVAFDRLLRKNAPNGFQPWYFRCRPGGKAPATKYGSWKDESAQLSTDEAVEWLEAGGNVGIAGTDSDRLVNVDIDDEDETALGDLKPTLITRSRSRTGGHGFYFRTGDEEIPNIPTDDAGEVRTAWQFVVAPGSYVEPDPDETIPDGEQADAGYYTVERAEPASTITFDELPDVFREENAESKEQTKILNEARREYEPPESTDGNSGLFDITAEDVARKEGPSDATDTDERWTALFHGSTSDANMSLSNENETTLNCWRHTVAHNGLQALAVLSGYGKGCKAVGTPHQKSGVGPSCLHGDDAHIWYAWKYAKENGYLPDDDKVPYRALLHLVREMGVAPDDEIPRRGEYDPDNGKRLPDYAYDAALSAINGRYGLNPGREKTAEIGTEEKGHSGHTAFDAHENKPDEEQAESNEDGQENDDNAGADDGGDNGNDGTDGGDDPSLNPITVAAEAGIDTDEDTLADLSDREKAYFTWELIDRQGAEYFLAAQPDGTIFCYEDGLWADRGEQRLRELGRQALGPAYSRNVHIELCEQARSAAPIQRSVMGTPSGTVAVANGLYHFQSGTVEPLHPEDHALFQAQAEYDPDAECPRFREFIGGVVREGDAATLQEYAGYTLLHWAQPYKRAMLLLGPQDSGKSTFLNVVKDILGGRDNVSAENLDSLVNTRWGTANLFGKVANITNELETKTLESIGLFKTLTGGGDTVSAEFKGKDKFEFEPTAKQLFATNQVPPTKESDDAFYSRWLYASFPEPVPPAKQVAGLDEKMLEEERSGILNWMLEGYERLQDQRGFSNDPMAGRKRERWEAYGNSIKRFKHNCLETTGDRSDAVAKSIAHSLYAVYCHEKIGSEVEGQRKLTGELKKDDKISDSKRKLHPDDKRRKVYTGVKFHPDALDALDFDPGAELAAMRSDTDTDDPEPDPAESSLSGFGGVE